MSWQDAQNEARLLIERLNLKNADIEGRLLDLNELLKACPHPEGRYRLMVYQAAARILKKRGANTNISDFVKD